MWNKLYSSSMGLALLLMIGAAANARQLGDGDFISRYNGDYLQKIRTDRVVTPHLPFARPLAGGALRALFIIPKAGVNTRDVVELWQRLDLVFEAVTVFNGSRIADDYFFTTAVLGESTPEKTRELNEKLDRSYDVICLANFCFDALPAACQYKVLHAVRNGTGLLGVFANTRSKQPIYQALVPPVPGRDVLRGCALAGLPYFYGAWRAIEIGDPTNRDEVADRLLTTAHFGKGRIAMLNYDAPANFSEFYAGDCLGRPAPLPTSQGYDVALGIAARALLWAAGREPAVRIVPGLPDGAAISLTNWPAAFTGRLESASGALPAKVTLEARLERPDGEIAFKAPAKLTPDGRTAAFAAVLPPSPRGTAFLYFIARDKKGAVLDWTITTLDVKAGYGIAAFTSSVEVAGPSGTVTFAATLQGAPPAGSRVRLEAVDAYDRVFFRQETQAAPALKFAVPLAAARGRFVEARARLFAGESLLDTARTECFIKRQVGREFINLIWGQLSLGTRSERLCGGYLSDLTGRRLQKAGFNTGMLFPVNGSDDVALASKASARADAHWLIYASHINPKSMRAQFDAEARAKEEKRLEELAARAAPFGPYVYSLGDECGYTVFEDLKPQELEAYHAYLQKAYGDIAALNRAWSGNYTNFDAVAPAPATGATWAVSRKYDLKAFWEQMYADTFHWEAEAIRRGDPQALVGAEGSMSGNLDLTISKLDWWSGVMGGAGRVNDALLRSWLPQDALRGNWWGAYTYFHGARAGPKILWSQLAGGAANASLFFVALAFAEGMLAADLDCADYLTPWLPEMRDICERAGPLLRASQPIDDGVGIYWSRLSELANELDPRFGGSLAGQNELLSRLDALGVNAKFVTERQILAGKLSPATTKVLFVCVAKAVPDALAPALDAYVNAGGIVIADVAPDLRDAHAAEASARRLLALFGAKATEQPKPVTTNIAFANVKKRRSDIGATVAPNSDSASAELGAGVLALTADACIVDAAVTTADGKALAAAGATPLLIVKSRGKGFALLLNFDFYHALATAKSDNATTTPAADFLLALLRVAGVTPAFQPQHGLPWETVRRFRHADAVIVGLIPSSQKALATNTFVVTPGHAVHPLRAGLGPDTVGALRLPDDYPDTVLFSVLPPAKRQISVRGPYRARPGDVLRFDVALNVGGLPVAGSLLRIDLLDPAGQPLGAHREFINSAATSFSIEIPMALNAPPGKYTVQVTELVSGVAASAAVKMRK